MTVFAIKSLNIGQPQIIERNGVQVKTSFGKMPVNVPVFLSETGFEGDQQADLENHGGRDKAVCLASCWWLRPHPPKKSLKNVLICTCCAIRFSTFFMLK